MLAIVLGVCLVIALRDPEPAAVTAESARAGQCIDLVETSDDSIEITEVACDEPHDAEIVLATDFGEAVQAGYDLDDADTVCPGLMAADDVSTLDDYDGDLEYGQLIDEPSNLDQFDRLVCFVRPLEGRLDASILG